MATGERHTPVLAGRVAQLLTPSLSAPGLSAPSLSAPGLSAPSRSVPSPVLVDATLGFGGHALLMLQQHPGLTVVGIDRDPSALAAARDRITAAGFADRFVAIAAIYDEMGAALDEMGIERVDGVLFDLGVSSMQLDETDRGFAYAFDAPLDMRMNPTTGVTAAEVLNTYAPGELVRILREYGEEKFAPRIVSEIVKQRDAQPWTTSARLVELIRNAIPAAARRTGGNPAKRTFQALRIEVNDELGALRRALPVAVERLRVGGRIVVLAYQSLEDRLVKQAIAPLTVSSGPLDLPVELPEHQPTLRWLTRGAGTPTDDEIAANPRAASARLRAAERIAQAREPHLRHRTREGLS